MSLKEQRASIILYNKSVDIILDYPKIQLKDILGVFEWIME